MHFYGPGLMMEAKYHPTSRRARCANLLKLPDYVNYHTLKAKVLQAIRHLPNSGDLGDDGPMARSVACEMNVDE